MKNKPTQRQEEILDYIREYIFETGYSPTQVEIRNHFGWVSTNAVACHLSSMKNKGFINYEVRRARTIRITTREH